MFPRHRKQLLASTLFLLVTSTLGLAIPEPLLRNPFDQMPIMAPPTTSTISSTAASQLLISDVLDRDRSINIFSGFTRDVNTAGFKLDSGLFNATVLAPENDAIRALPRKPWQDPRDGEQVYKGDDGDERAARNLRRFVEAHIVPSSPWEVGTKAKTVNGNEVWVEEKGGKWMIQPSDVEVVRVAEQVYNGEVWVLKGALNYT